MTPTSRRAAAGIKATAFPRSVTEEIVRRLYIAVHLLCSSRAHGDARRPRADGYCSRMSTGRAQPAPRPAGKIVARCSEPMTAARCGHHEAASRCFRGRNAASAGRRGVVASRFHLGAAKYAPRRNIPALSPRQPLRCRPVVAPFRAHRWCMDGRRRRAVPSSGFDIANIVAVVAGRVCSVRCYIRVDLAQFLEHRQAAVLRRAKPLSRLPAVRRLLLSAPFLVQQTVSLFSKNDACKSKHRPQICIVLYRERLVSKGLGIAFLHYIRSYLKWPK